MRLERPAEVIIPMGDPHYPKVVADQNSLSRTNMPTRDVGPSDASAILGRRGGFSCCPGVVLLCPLFAHLAARRRAKHASNRHTIGSWLIVLVVAAALLIMFA
jgi:hypothetical protein